tara:strand:- start:609 stop:881 length:273 start_codon:yes stop_codon:yes gene_type:complete
MTAMDHADKFIEIYRNIKIKNYKKANELFMKNLTSIIFTIQSIDTLVCYGKRIFAYRIGIKTVFDRKPFVSLSDFGLKKSQNISKKLGSY